MKITTCICGGPKGNVEEVGEKDGREVVKCNECGTIRTLYIPEDYGALYTEGDTYHHKRVGHTAYTDRFQHDYQIAQFRFTHHLGAFRLLDVGCANGGWVRAASDLGFDSHGLELNPHMADWARGATGRPIYTSWDNVPGVFDLITYHDVIEHVEDPIEEVRRASKYLRSGGVLVLDTPDAADPRFKELGMGWHHMKPQEHLWFFTGESLLEVIRASDLLPERVEQPIPGKLVIYARKRRYPAI
jgi:2-polyprenyl-3-methyl-5-hydroxy-6-metoxy-1,4-benzoquinol methylase